MLPFGELPLLPGAKLGGSYCGRSLDVGPPAPSSHFFLQKLRIAIPTSTFARWSSNILSAAVGVMKLLRRVSPKDRRGV
jgi:hypothetical protein